MARRRQEEVGDAGGRQRLLQAAARLFGARGYAATTVRDVLRAAGVTAPVLYYHFGNKEGLWLALVREGLARLEAAQQAATAGAGTAADRIRGLCRATFEVRRQHADLHRVVWEILAGPPAAVPRLDLRDLASRFVARLQGMVEEGVASGELAPCTPLHVALALAACLNAAIGLRVVEVPGSDPADELEGMMAVVLGGLVRRGGGELEEPGTTPATRARRCS